MTTKHSGPASVAIRNAGSDCVYQRLTVALADILHTPMDDVVAQTAHLLAPAVLAQTGVRALIQPAGKDGQFELGQWAGLVHRRCRISGQLPVHAEAAETLTLNTQLINYLNRADWTAMRTCTRIMTGEQVCASVQDDFARQTSQMHARMTPSASRLGSQLGATIGPREHYGPLTLTQVRAWAQASGDYNPIHVQLGAAARAGLPVPATSVVAHGLLAAALELHRQQPGELTTFSAALSRAGRGRNQKLGSELDLRFYPPVPGQSASVLLPRVQISVHKSASSDEPTLGAC